MLGDVLVIAGDIGTPRIVARVADEVSKRWKDVIFVPGNHEYYSHRVPFQEIRKELHHTFDLLGNVHLLDNETITIRGQRFVGSTLWSRFDPMWSLDGKEFAQNVVSGGDIDQSELINAENDACVDFLHRTVKEGDVVITHFMPMQPTDLRAKKVRYAYRPSALDTYYGNTGLEPVMARAKLWISGHTHVAFDTAKFGCRWVCNPLGHPHEKMGADQNGVVIPIK